MKGHVYILRNPAFPTLVKVGKTTRDPAARARRLSSRTGVPAPYEVAWTAEVSDCGEVERLIHKRLAYARSRSDREFFAVSVAEATAVASSIAEPFRIPREHSVCSRRASVSSIAGLLALVAVALVLVWSALRGMSCGSPPSYQQRRVDVRTTADADAPPLELVGIVVLDEPEPRRQAILRNRQSGENLRVFEGHTVYISKRSGGRESEDIDTFLDAYHVVSITADAVTVADSKGEHHKLRGRPAGGH